MALDIRKAERSFVYNKIPLADPDPKLSVQEVRDFYANVYPEITTAEIEGPEQKDHRIVYTFRRAVGTKGGDGDKFDQWAVVELFGHQQIAGRVSEASIGGCSFLRVDVPDQPELPKHGYYENQPAIPAYTRYFGNGAIYALNPCTEAAARAMAARIRTAPAIPYDPPKPVKTLLGNVGEDDVGYSDGQ